ncbi:MAG TPA: hypothetical protein VGN13_05425 [Solirubrobacteraceae bacterium]|jgi:hypothetical protein
MTRALTILGRIALGVPTVIVYVIATLFLLSAVVAAALPFLAPLFR